MPLPDPSTLDADTETGSPRRVPRPSRSTSSARCCPTSPDAWIDHTKTKIGYEIPLTRHFYRYVPPRPLAEIDAEIKQLESRDPGAARAR